MNLPTLNSMFVILLLCFIKATNACRGNPFKKTCGCNDGTNGFETTWAPLTTFRLQRGSYDCSGSGKCRLQYCAATLFHSCPSCDGNDFFTRELDTPGWMTRYDIWDMFIPGGDDESCFDKNSFLGTTEDGQNIYSTVIVPPHSTIEIPRTWATQRWTPDGGDVLLPHAVEFLHVNC